MCTVVHSKKDHTSLACEVCSKTLVLGVDSRLERVNNDFFLDPYRIVEQSIIDGLPVIVVGIK